MSHPAHPMVLLVDDHRAVREAMAQLLEEYGFTFGEVETEGGEEVLIGTQEDGSCQQGVKLVGPQEAISRVYLSVFGCSDGDTQGNITGFMPIFFYNLGEDEFVDSPWLGQLFAWNVTDVYYVIEGVQTDPVSIEIENVLFTAEVNPDKEYAVDITADILP